MDSFRKSRDQEKYKIPSRRSSCLRTVNLEETKTELEISCSKNSERKKQMTYEISRKAEGSELFAEDGHQSYLESIKNNASNDVEVDDDLQCQRVRSQDEKSPNHLVIPGSKYPGMDSFRKSRDQEKYKIPSRRSSCLRTVNLEETKTELEISCSKNSERKKQMTYEISRKAEGSELFAEDGHQSYLESIKNNASNDVEVDDDLQCQRVRSQDEKSPNHLVIPGSKYSGMDSFRKSWNQGN